MFCLGLWLLPGPHFVKESRLEVLLDTKDAQDQMDATLVVKLGYRGEAFCGFAEQPGQRTVAGELHRALETSLRRPCELVCAGRTDAGVHAISQFVSVPVRREELASTGQGLLRSLVALTPDDLSVSELYLAPAGFSARFDARSRAYRYRICAGQARPVMAFDHSWWYKGTLDVEAMDAAAQLLVGEHDFKSFCKAISAVDKPTCRFVESLCVHEIEEAGEKLIAIDIRGNAFLHNMVRTIAGTLVEVGRGHRKPEWVSDVLAACDRKAAGPCAPAKGLCFIDVDYGAAQLEKWA